jgi:dephospho-CoA kinase
MNVVALTGGIGSGKSAAADTFQKLGVTVIDLDEISRQLTATGSPIINKIATEFGHGYVTEDGAMNRTMMRALVFSQPQARDRLNAIMHPAIYEEAVRQLALHQQEAYVVLAIPLLVESPQYRKIVDHVVLVDCDEKLQLERVMERSGLSSDEVMAIMRAQSSRQARLKLADTVIVNDGNLQDLSKKIRDFHENYINTCIVSQLL